MERERERCGGRDGAVPGGADAILGVTFFREMAPNHMGRFDLALLSLFSVTAGFGSPPPPPPPRNTHPIYALPHPVPLSRLPALRLSLSLCPSVPPCSLYFPRLPLTPHLTLSYSLHSTESERTVLLV